MDMDVYYIRLRGVNRAIDMDVYYLCLCGANNCYRMVSNRYQ